MVNNTPMANRLHIGLFGKRNSGKSSLINAITHQEVALVSDIPGTTTDPVFKAMEVFGLGPCVFIDTAGVDDEGELGELRVKQTYRAFERTDLALIVCTDAHIEKELEIAARLKKRNIPVIWVLNKTDLYGEAERETISREIEQQCQTAPMAISCRNREGIHELLQRLASSLSGKETEVSILGSLVEEGQVVMLVMPQDIQAPKGRLILPQVQTLRELLDRKCIAVSCTTDKIDQTLASLSRPPHLIITDSQVFDIVFQKKPEASKLTSFSVLFAQYKGDIHYYIEGVKKMASLNAHSRILIAEACTHAPQSEDIGTVKIPRMLHKKFGPELQIDHVAGNDFPEDLTPYDLVIHCGGCMFNRKHVLNRIDRARQQGVAMTNYGIFIAYIHQILDKIDY